MLNIALDFRQAGISTVPLIYGTQFPAGKVLPQVPKSEGGTKGTYKPFQSTIPTEGQLRRWFNNGKKYNLAVVTGMVSNGLFILDFDLEANKSIRSFKQTIGEGLFSKLTISQTYKGFHIWARYGELVGSKKLALDEEKRILIETKGAGVLCSAPPSKHKNSTVKNEVFYKWVQGSVQTIPFLSTPEYFAVMGAAALLNRFEPKQKQQRKIFIEPAQIDLDEARLRQVKRYCGGIIRNIVSDLAHLTEGSRNHQLNRTAYIGGRYIAAGLYPKDSFMAELEQACNDNKLIHDDGQAAFEASMQSGLMAGLSRPVVIGDVIQRMEQGKLKR